MRGSGFGAEGGTVTVLVHEFVTGGGLWGRDLPSSWVAEGSAMRRAISEDFAARPEVRVFATLDRRLASKEIPKVEVVPIGDEPGQAVARLAARSDYTVLVAPETDGLLAEATRSIVESGARHLGSSPDAVALAGDKARLAEHFEALDIPTPPTRVVADSERFPDAWPGPLIFKPLDGAGSLDTFVVDPARGLRLGSGRGPWLVQPHLPGASMSASLLVDRDGRGWPIAVGRQRIEVDAEGRVSYRGGVVPAPTSVDLSTIVRAVESVPGLRGFVGVDFLDDGRGSAVVLEINPRPTTSYVGLVRLLQPGTIASAWLAAIDSGLTGTDWPKRLRSAEGHPPVEFEADGGVRDRGEDR